MGTGIRIVTVINRKGGCGKSTICRALASAASARGEAVTIFDSDVSGSCYNWMLSGKERGNWQGDVKVIPMLDGVEILEAIGQIYEQSDQDHLILIDTFGGGSEAIDELAAAAHLVITPMMLSRGDFRETAETMSWFSKLRDRAEDPSLIPPIGVLINRAPVRLSVIEDEIMNDVAASFPAFPMVLQNRNAFVRMDTEGLLGDMIANCANAGLATNLSKALAEATDLLVICDKFAGSVRE